MQTSSLSGIGNKVNGFDNATIWSKSSKLAVQSQTEGNLGQGFPEWLPPKFLIDSLHKHLNDPNVNHQYTRGFGNVKLVQAVSKLYSPIFNRTIDPLNEILVANGAVSVLYNAITALIQPGDEMVVIEPFYDCYLPQAVFSGGKVTGVPMIPPQVRDIKTLKDLKEEDIPNMKDEWKMDFEKLKQAINNKTKILVLNTPNNPTGKILTEEELKIIAEIVAPYPDLVVLMDEVYEFMIYDNYEVLPRFANIPGMWERTISIMSAGKIFSCTGFRIGWAIGPQKLIKKLCAVFQVNSFCIYDPCQLAIADAINIGLEPYEGEENYFKWLRIHYTKQRNYFILNFIKNVDMGINLYFPEGGYFVTGEISNLKNEQSQFRYDTDAQDAVYSKDFNVCLDIAYNKKVIFIPCSVFYTSEHTSFGENLVRLAFCKKFETIDRAFSNLRSNN